MTTTHNLTKQVLLVICDGMGYSDNTNKNAVRDANTPNLDSLFENYPFTTIEPGGEAVGLPKGVAGNSEVGHLNLGAGRPVRQDLVRINEAIENDTLKSMPKLQELIQKTLEGNKRLHLLGLLSDGGVHSHIEHTKAILEILKSYPEIKVFYHAFMDGRDTLQTNGPKYIEELLKFDNFTFASMQGRSIGMDRDRRWEKIKHAYDTMTGRGEVTTETPLQFIKKEYAKEIFDEFITPVLFDIDGAIQSADTVFFTNFRPDRARQITTTFCDKRFEPFKNDIRPSYFLCMSPYVDEELPEVPILFDKEKLSGTLAEFISKSGLRQLKIAETEKYAHVTYFFNGGEEKPYEGEERVLVNSPKDVKTYDEKPEMSAPQVLDKLMAKLDDETISVYICNFANADMVGHTGNYEAAVKAVEYVDYCIGELSKKCLNNGIAMLITADHGNADLMVYPDGSPHTSHSNSVVPFCLVHSKLKGQKLHVNDGINALKDVSPTMVNLLGLKMPASFTGHSIFE